MRSMHALRVENGRLIIWLSTASHSGTYIISNNHVGQLINYIFVVMGVNTFILFIIQSPI